MPGIDRAGDRGREDDRPTLLKRDESIGPGGIVRRKIRARDGDETPAIGKARQRRADMAKRGVRHAAIDMGDGRKGRVHQDDARADVGVEMIVDLRRIEARDRNAGEQPGEKPRASIREFVEGERAASELGEDREEACAGRGLQNKVGRVIAAAVAAQKPSGIGVENCCKAWLSSERRVWVGSSPATLVSIASMAPGVAARACMAGPNLRKKRTVAASQAS